MICISEYILKEKQDDLIIYQYYGRAKDMPKRMREHFEFEGITFDDDEWISINEYVIYSIENRWK